MVAQKKEEKSPDGSQDQNVFDIMTGVSINIFVQSKRNSALAKSISHRCF